MSTGDTPLNGLDRVMVLMWMLADEQRPQMWPLLNDRCRAYLEAHAVAKTRT